MIYVYLEIVKEIIYDNLYVRVKLLNVVCYVLRLLRIEIERIWRVLRTDGKIVFFVVLGKIRF